jgi:hypothetical protein
MLGRSEPARESSADMNSGTSLFIESAIKVVEEKEIHRSTVNAVLQITNEQFHLSESAMSMSFTSLHIIPASFLWLIRETLMVCLVVSFFSEANSQNGSVTNALYYTGEWVSHKHV